MRNHRPFIYTQPIHRRTAPAWIVLIALALFAAGCGGAAVTPTQPTPTPSAGDDWKTYSAAGGRAQFAYPPTWSETEPGYLSGADGYARVDVRSSEGAGPGALCQSEANRDKPETYGMAPEIRDMEIEGQPACVILPSGDQPSERAGEGLLLAWLPESLEGEEDVLAVRAGGGHLVAIAGSLTLAGTEAEPTSNCDFSPAGGPVESIREGGLNVDLIPLADEAGCIPTLQAADFYPYIDSEEVTARLGYLRGLQSDSSRLNRLNGLLRPYNMNVQTYDDGLFRLLQNGNTVRDNISWIGPFSASPDGSDFLLPMLDGYNATAYIAGPDGVEPLDDPDLLVFDNIFPVITDAGRVRLTYDTQTIPRSPGSPALLRVRRDGEEIALFSVSGSNPAAGPVRSFWSWQGSWYVQLPGLVMKDGAILNDELGCAEIFSWRLLRDRPFYLCRQDGSIHTVFDGQTLPLAFDEVIHEPQVGSAALLQMRGYESGLGFLARRNGLWVYVVIEAE